MKKQILLCLIAGLLSAPFLYAAAYTTSYQTNTTQQTSKIELKGDYDNKGGNTLLVLFQKDVGVLQVTVTGLQGEVYATAVNTEMPSVLSVPFAGLPSGNYTVTFSGERGIMWGEFEI